MNIWRHFFYNFQRLDICRYAEGFRAERHEDCWIETITALTVSVRLMVRRLPIDFRFTTDPVAL